MWEPRRLTILWVCTACYRGSSFWRAQLSRSILPHPPEDGDRSCLRNVVVFCKISTYQTMDRVQKKPNSSVHRELTYLNTKVLTIYIQQCHHGFSANMANGCNIIAVERRLLSVAWKLIFLKLYGFYSGNFRKVERKFSVATTWNV
jgi:hypothetical protein